MAQSTFETNPLLMTDAYKIGHQLLYPKGTQVVYSTLTPRINSYFPWNDKMVVFGYEAFFKKLKIMFDEGFFYRDKYEVVAEAIETISDVMGEDVAHRVTEKFEALHDLGYLPIRVRALPEGTVATNKKFVVAFDSIMDVPNVFVDGKDVSKVGGNNLGISDLFIHWNTNTNIEGEKLLFIRSLTKGSDNGGVIENTVKETNVDEYL